MKIYHIEFGHPIQKKLSDEWMHSCLLSSGIFIQWWNLWTKPDGATEVRENSPLTFTIRKTSQDYFLGTTHQINHLIQRYTSVPAIFESPTSIIDKDRKKCIDDLMYLYTDVHQKCTNIWNNIWSYPLCTSKGYTWH